MTIEGKPETVLEWLRWAQEKGCPWASDALEQCRHYNQNDNVDSLKDAVAAHCDWDDADGGFDRWSAIYHTLESDEHQWKAPPRRAPAKKKMAAKKKATKREMWRVRVPSTILGWFRWAVATGEHDWAESAIRQYDPDFHGETHVTTLRDAMMRFCCWDDTGEGGVYWNRKHEEIRDVEWRKLPRKSLPDGGHKPTTVLTWLQWARDAGYEWAESACKQCRVRSMDEVAHTLDDALKRFNSWSSTSEGRSHWKEIHLKAVAIQWRLLKVEPEPIVLPIGCLTFDEFVDHTVMRYLLEFAAAWGVDNAQLKMFTPPEKGFTFELRDKCMLRALNALNDAEFEAEVVSVTPDGCYIARKRRAA